jgi:hypothetical protein
LLPLTNLTVTPPSDVDSGMESAPAMEEAKFDPKMETSDPPVMGCPETKLAPFTIPPGVIFGVWATASPAIAIIKAKQRIRIDLPVFTIVGGARLGNEQEVNKL